MPRTPPSLASITPLWMSTSLGWCHPGFELQLPTFCTSVASPPHAHFPIPLILTSSWGLPSTKKFRPPGSRDFQCKKRLISDDAHAYKEIQIFKQ
jgi:hypothetical protein